MGNEVQLPRTVLVTGATGFIGHQLCGRLLAESVRVRGAVRGAERSAILPDGVEAAPIGSIGAATDWSPALRGVDTVVHLAARVHVMDDGAANPLMEYRSVNVDGTARLARQAAASGVRRLVFISSVKVNGEGRICPYTEQDVPSPLDPYGISKWEAEQMLRVIAAETGLEVVVLRLPLVYGPGVKANFLRLLETVSRGAPLPVSRIHNRRSLLFSGNLVDAIVACSSHPKAVGQTFLVSDGEDVSTSDLVRLVAFALGRPAWLFPVPPPLLRLAGKLAGKSAAVDRLLGSLAVDASKVRNVLGWAPPFSMAEGLGITAEWYKGRGRNGHAEAFV